MTLKDLNQRLSGNCPEVVAMLLPNGKKMGREWCVGSLSGEEGSSLKVHLAGPKAGVWSDFATGEKGDLIDLWRAVKNVSFADTSREIRAYLGIPESRLDREPKKSYRRPEVSGKPLSERGRGFLRARKITDETMNAFGIRETDSALVFPYYREGEIIHEKFRNFGEKKFWSSKETEPCLFGWQALREDAREVVICEGEIDCLTLHQYGYNALSVPFGAGEGDKMSWIENEYSRLALFDTLFLCFDMDEPGQKSIPELSRRLGRERCRIVSLPFKDANECLLKKMPSLDDFFMAAKTCDPDGLTPASSFMPGALDLLLGTNERDSGIPLPWCDNLRLRPSELTIWNGYNGHGKTSLLNHLAIEILNLGENVLYCSHEMDPTRLMAQMLRQACGDGKYTQARTDALSGGLFGGLFIYTGKNDRLDAIRYAARRYGASHVIIDNLTRLCRMDDYSGQQKIVEDLSSLKDELRLHIHLIVHARKGESESNKPDKHDVRGAGPITDIADNVVTIHRNKMKTDLISGDKPYGRREADQLHDATLHVQKQRVDGWEGSRKVWYDRVSCQFGSEPGFPPVRYDDIAVSDIPF